MILFQRDNSTMKVEPYQPENHVLLASLEKLNKIE